ncbi:protein of unknown function [Rhodovastum atsumiense]|nr:protein of unknown function [Rhodovastum atsumiense]
MSMIPGDMTNDGICHSSNICAFSRIDRPPVRCRRVVTPGLSHPAPALRIVTAGRGGPNDDPDDDGAYRPRWLNRGRAPPDRVERE